MKKDVETINKTQKEMKNTISELNTVEGIKSRLDEGEDWISELEDKVEKNSQKQQEEGKKRLKKNKEGLRKLQGNMKRNNIHIIGISGAEEEGIENLFEK